MVITVFNVIDMVERQSCRERVKEFFPLGVVGAKVLTMRWVCTLHQVEVLVHLNIYWWESALTKHLQLAPDGGPAAQRDPLNVLLQTDAFSSISVCHYRL